MHWEKATWASVLWGVAFVLAVPLNVLANLLTPKLRNWWSERSVTVLQKRTEKLEADLETLSELEPLSDAELRILVTLSYWGFWCCTCLL